MRVLVTGARGFVGRNLCESLKAIRDGKDRRERYQGLLPLTVWECDVDTPRGDLERWCAGADFVFNLAGVNRPEDPADFMAGNFGFASELLGMLERGGNRCSVMLASSAQASLEGRYAGSAYGESKLAGEGLFFEYSERTGAPVLVYRFPNLYGKWCRPRYNSAVATFCDAIANGRPYTVSDPSVELELLHIDDLVEEMLSALLGEEHRCGYDGLEPVPDPAGRYCYCPVTDRATLGEIVSLLESFKMSRDDLSVPDLTEGSLSKKLWSTFESYYGAGSLAYPLRANRDERGSFTEFLRTPERGQVSVNVSKPGVTKGNHWHHTKWERFLVVSGEALVRLRRVGLDESGEPYPVDEYRVSGDNPIVVEMAPGMTHSITNLSATDDLVTVMWANEPFDPEDPDTFHEEV
ncbi:polysaccharide biosynthesis C-terminal domain-containing protein [Collinsella tanakaei]|uniref:polysaccharide biosynthesis C-terminal domain-containing protein n=1 Tax=Collinsella tanakaei TaxID=626935 RepID=UPI001F15762C|nr:NAD-dependent epimerase/dehydratase family protein [Collinsella tanakaei]MCF2622198.1 NAD-dependent epimerase/dehydratase family protein [Collinsella tanakaei]